jgi:hypothetical protein
MEKRSSRRIRTLMARLAHRGIHPYEIGRAHIHGGPEHKSSKLRPDTLVQDRRIRFDEPLLRRAAGPYISATF